MTARAVTACLASLLGLACCNRLDDSTGPKPTAPPLPPLAEPASQAVQGRSVLLAVVAQQAVPLFCHDHGQKRLGADCATLLPQSATVRLSGSLSATLQPAGQSVCSLGGKPVPGYSLSGLEITATEQRVALWSDSLHPVMTTPPWPAEHQPETPSQLRGMKHTCDELSRAQTDRRIVPLPQTTWLVDLDGDGVRERIDDVRCGEPTQPQAIAQVLFLTPGRRPERTMPLRLVRHETETVRLEVVVDVDANGVPEVVLSQISPSSQRIEVAHLARVGLIPIGVMECSLGKRR